MANIASDETKRIPSERWEAWCDTFTNGNRGRLIRLELISDELGVEPMVEGAALARPGHVGVVAKRFPGVAFIAAHLGNPSAVYNF